jgi:hypothetical protein
LPIRFYHIIAIIIITGSLSACNYFKKKEPEKPNPIARVGDNFLYAEDLQYLFENPEVMTDSAALVKTYVEDWIRKRLLLETATKYLPDDKQNLEKKIQDYKESLLIYLYEDELLKQRLDTTVSETAIDSFYSAYKDNFRLEAPIFKLMYIKLPKDAPKIDSIKYLFSNSGSEKNYKRLVNYCYSYATDFYLKDSLWISEANITKNTPLEVSTISQLEKSNQSVEVSDSNYLYLLKKIDSKSKGQPAPLEFVKKDLNYMIVNKRKQQLLNNTYDKIYKDAIKDGTFEIYNQ